MKIRLRFRVLAMLSVQPLLATLEVAGNASPASAVPAAPLPTYSYYLGTVNQQTLYNLGYSFGEDTAAGQRLSMHCLFLIGAHQITVADTVPSCREAVASFESLAAELAATEEFGWVSITAQASSMKLPRLLLPWEWPMLELGSEQHH